MNRDATNVSSGRWKPKKEVDHPPGDAAVVFDQAVSGPVLVFAPDRPRPVGDEHRWWWTGPASPEIIDEVLDIACRGTPALEAIVIGGLDRYPIGGREWPKWLAHWSQKPGLPPVIVETGGLKERDRHRLIQRTRRQVVLRNRQNPVAMIATAIRDWFSGRSP